MSELIKKSLKFIMPLAGGVFLIKDTLKSDEIQNVKLGQSENADDLMNFTLSGDTDKIKLSVSKTGQAKVIADDEISEVESAKFLAEINKNCGKLFEKLLENTETDINSVDRILAKKYDNEIDFNSSSQVSDAIKLYIEERKRITALATIVNRKKLIPRFEAETGLKFSNESLLKDKNVVFSFINASNEYFNGMNLTVKDNDKGTIQKFIVSDDGGIYKTPVYSRDNSVPPAILIKNLTLLTPDEINSPDVKYMLNYAFVHTDLVFKYILEDFYKGKHSGIDKLDRLIEDEKKSQIDLSAKPFAEERAKVVRIIDFKPELMENIKEIESYRNRISKAYNSAFRLLESLESIEENSGLIRKKFSNDFIIKDILLPEGMLLGISKYTYAKKSDEILSFDIYDKNTEQIARFKVMKDGKSKLLVKLNSDAGFIANISEIIENEFKNGLTEKILPKLKEACYYHENRVKVKTYMDYFGISASQAIKELMIKDSSNGITGIEVVKRKPGRPKKDLSYLPTKVENDKPSKPVKPKEKAKTARKSSPKAVSLKSDVSSLPKMRPELIERYANMLKPNGEFKGLDAISLSDVCTQLDRIFSLSYTERSPHLIHEKLDNGRIFEGRFSVMAPDGARVTVSKMKTSDWVDFTYYSIKIEKDGQTTDISIHPEKMRTLEKNADGTTIKNGKGDKLTISKADFISENPLCKNMSMYFGEIFDERPEVERQIIPFRKKENKNAKLLKQKMQDVEKAMAFVPKYIQKEMLQEMESMEDYDDE